MFKKAFKTLLIAIGVMLIAFLLEYDEDNFDYLFTKIFFWSFAAFWITFGIRNKAKKINVITELKYYAEKKQIKTTTSLTIQQVKAECEALVQKKNIEHQQLLESATAEAMDRANESEREVQVQIAALKVCPLDTLLWTGLNA